MTIEKAAPVPSGEPWRGSGTILLVDDEEIALTVGRAMLEKIGFEVLTAMHGPLALEMFREHGDRIRLVVLDMLMPGMDGVEVFHELRKIDPDVRALIASGHMKGEAAERFGNRIPAGFIHKPYNMKELSKTIREAIKESDLK